PGTGDGATLGGGAAAGAAVTPGSNTLASQLVQTALGAVDWGAILRSLLEATKEALAGGSGLAADVATWLLQTPPITEDTPELRPLHELANALRFSTLSLLIVLFLATVYKTWFLGQGRPAEVFARLGGAALLLGCYPLVVRKAIEAANALTAGILRAAVPMERPDLAFVLGAVSGNTPFTTAALGVVGLVFVWLIAFLRVLGIVYLVALYVAGPLLIPCALLEQTAGWFRFWWESALRLLAWGPLWAIEVKLFTAIISGMGLRGYGGPVFTSLAAVALLYAMYKTPRQLVGPSVAQGTVVLRQVTDYAVAGGRAAARAGRAAATGGTSAAAEAAAGAAQAGAAAGRATKKAAG
ncbi:MAG: hypothetical protein M3Q65_18360, partial [Chloroflexota bacterium]|nr:hypothetical protein [Chloroflexota bacterium]